MKPAGGVPSRREDVSMKYRALPLLVTVALRFGILIHAGASEDSVDLQAAYKRLGSLFRRSHEWQ